jgi:hypothetical protein
LTVDDGPVITDGPKLRAIFEAGGVGTDGPPGVADFAQIVQIARGPYSGPGAYDGAHEIDSLLVLDRSPAGLALRYVDPLGNVTTLEREVASGLVVPVDGGVLLARPPSAYDGQEITISRYTLDGSPPTPMGTILRPSARAGRLVLTAMAYAPESGLESYLVAFEETLYRWTPGSPLSPLPLSGTYGEMPGSVVSIAVDRSGVDPTFYLKMATAEVEGASYWVIVKRDAGGVMQVIESRVPPNADMRFVAGKLRVGQDQWTVPWPTAPDTHLPDPIQGNPPSQVDRSHDSIGIRDNTLVRFTKKDRSDAVLFAGREFAGSSQSLTNCQLSEGPRRSPWLACHEGATTLELATGTLAPLRGPLPTYAWIDGSTAGELEALTNDGVYWRNGVAQSEPIDGAARPVTRAARDTDGALWALSSGTAGGLYRAAALGQPFVAVGSSFTAAAYTSLAAVHVPDSTGVRWTRVFGARETLVELPAQTPVTLVGQSGTYLKLRRFGEVLYGATASTVDRIDVEKHTATTVLGTPGRYGFSSDGSAVPFIDDFTFDAQGGIVIYSNATRSVYYARP